MYIFQKDEDDIIVINSETCVLRFLSDEDKISILDILPQLCNSQTVSIGVDDLPEGARVMIHEEIVQKLVYWLYLKYEQEMPSLF